MNTLRISRKEKKGVGGQKTLPMKILHLFYLFSITLSNIRIAPNAFGKQNHFDPPPPPSRLICAWFFFLIQRTLLH